MSRARNLKTRKNTKILFEHKEGLEFIVFDTETTGTDPARDRIIELSAIKFVVNNHTAIQIDSMDLYIKPPFLMEQKIIDIHGITNEFLADKPTEEEVFKQIKEFFGQTPVVVGHNIVFDISMLNALYLRQLEVFTPEVYLDTVEMARDLITDKETENYKLKTLADLYGLSDGITFHNAMDDVKATSRLLVVFYDEYCKLPPIPPKQTIWINNISFWKGMNRNQTGIWLNTSLGKMFFSTMNKAWYSSQIDLDTVDIDRVEKEVLDKLQMTSLAEFGRLTEKKFEILKNDLRAKGVYI